MRAVLLNTPNICQHHDESTRHYLWRVTEILSSVMDIYVLKNSFTVCFSCECMTELSQKRKSSQCKYMTMKMAEDEHSGANGSNGEGGTRENRPR